MEEYLESLTEDEKEEFLDSVILSIGESARAHDEKAAIVVPQNISRVQFVHAVAKFLTKGQDASVTYKLHVPYKSMGSVTIEGSPLILQSKWFYRAAEFSNNTEMYPLLNGKIRITFTFHGLTTPIE